MDKKKTGTVEVDMNGGTKEFMKPDKIYNNADNLVYVKTEGDAIYIVCNNEDQVETVVKKMTTRNCALKNYEEWDEGEDKKWILSFFVDDFPEWISIKASYKSNPRMSETDIQEARKSMSEAEFRQEYEADFNTYEGQVWNFKFDECVGAFHEMDTSGMDVFAGLDVGYRDPTAFCVIAYSWDEEKYFLLDEYLDAERTTEQHATEIRDLIDKWDIDYIYIDSAAQQTRFDFAQNYDITTVNAKKSILDGISHVQAIVDNDRLQVDQSCKETLQSLDQYQWDPNPNLLKEKPKHNRASHMADALRYALYSFETSNSGF